MTIKSLTKTFLRVANDQYDRGNVAFEIAALQTITFTSLKLGFGYTAPSNLALAAGYVLAAAYVGFGEFKRRDYERRKDLNDLKKVFQDRLNELNQEIERRKNLKDDRSP